MFTVAALGRKSHDLSYQSVSINLTGIFNLEKQQQQHNISRLPNRFEPVYRVICLVILQIITHNPTELMEAGLSLMFYLCVFIWLLMMEICGTFLSLVANL